MLLTPTKPWTRRRAAREGTAAGLSFTARIEKYGMLTLSDISGSAGNAAAEVTPQVVPLRNPMFRGDDTRTEDWHLTRTWYLFFESLRGRSGSSRVLHASIAWVNELETADVWATIGPVDGEPGEIKVTPFVSTPRKDRAPFSRDWQAGDYFVWNDPDSSVSQPGRRKYECGQVTAIDEETGEWTIVRNGVFDSPVDVHFDVRLYRLRFSHFDHDLADGLPEKWDIVLPSACVVSVHLAGASAAQSASINCSYPVLTDPRGLPAAPGLRTNVGAAYWWVEPGDITVGSFYPAAPIRIQDWANIRTIYGYIGTPAPGVTSESLAVLVRWLPAADRIDGIPIESETQPWQSLERLEWTGQDIASCDAGSIESHPWTGSHENPPADRLMPYCDQGVLWDQEHVGKAWPVPVLEADGWLTFDVLTVENGTDEEEEGPVPPKDITIVVQT